MSTSMEHVFAVTDKDGNNLLQMTVMKSPPNMERIACLLELCPSFLSHCNHDGLTVLHMAVMQKDKQIIAQILGVDPKAMHGIPYAYPNTTPFQMAVERNELEIVKYMLAIDPDGIKLLNRHNRSVLYLTTDPVMVAYLLECEPTLIDGVDTRGDTPLHHFVQFGKPLPMRTFEILVQKKPTLLCAKNQYGDLVLDLAHKKGLFGCVEICIRVNPNLQYYDNGHDDHGDTVLHLVAMHSPGDDKELIARTTTIRKHELLMRNTMHKTPLDVAIRHVNTNVLNVFRLHCALDDIIASYRTHMPTMNIDAWTLEQCSMLNSFLLTDLVSLTLSYLGVRNNKRKHM